MARQLLVGLSARSSGAWGGVCAPPCSDGRACGQLAGRFSRYEGGTTEVPEHVSAASVYTLSG